MISKALQIAAEALDQFLKNKFALDESKVILNHLIESNGNVPQINQNMLVISLVNIEMEATLHNTFSNQKIGEGHLSKPYHLELFNLYILVSSDFDDYAESLKFLDATILFFHTNPVMNMNPLPEPPANLSKLLFEFKNISYQEMQNLWTAMGAKYRPSVIYKMRLLTMQ